MKFNDANTTPITNIIRQHLIALSQSGKRCVTDIQVDGTTLTVETIHNPAFTTITIKEKGD